MRVVIDNAARRAYLAEERRSAHRNRVFKGATIVFNKGHSVFECLVRNQNERGAKLCLDQAFALPTSFAVSVNDIEGERQARVVWRGPTEIGVRFVDEAV
jgi:hypothetical protein